jgi:hypothetical protein
MSESQMKRKAFGLASALNKLSTESFLYFPFVEDSNRGETAEDVPVRVHNHGLSVCAAVAMSVKQFYFETTAAAAS